MRGDLNQLVNSTCSSQSLVQCTIFYFVTRHKIIMIITQYLNALYNVIQSESAI